MMPATLPIHEHRVWTETHPAIPLESVVRAVILYDTAVAGLRAMRSLHAVDQDLAPESVHMDVKAWRFDILSGPNWRAAASADLAWADVIVLAASDRSSVPGFLWRWLAEELQHKESKERVVGVLLGGLERRGPAHALSLAPFRNPMAGDGLDVLPTLPPVGFAMAETPSWAWTPPYSHIEPYCHGGLNE